MCVWTKALGFYMREEKRKRGLGREGVVWDTWATVKVIRISCISTFNHPPLLLPTFLSTSSR
ncbi:Uncharacterized protein APZ42_021971 [Daphnia magna]|uniref:Uncharacterized protein n=1 Tax=Daphnia magna TaxID=35525 RepID=A0A164W6W0_9CRUS|nr:Uncharacterized protein APZ42_021971 [Daphnia magna]